MKVNGVIYGYGYGYICLKVKTEYIWSLIET